MKRLILITFLIIGMQAAVMAQSHRSINDPMPTRQVHLDFHTSEHIPDIGKEFDKKQFQEALKLGNINQINIFGNE